MLVCTTVVAQEQEKDVTKFLGIPIDGYKSEMIQKLKDKGFVYSNYDDTLSGEFNGSSVTLSVVTNNNKVYRVAVFDTNSYSEGDIKIRFNNLCNQFDNSFILLANINEDNSVNYVAKSSSDKIDCGSIVKSLAVSSSGNGGGSKSFAQGGGTDSSNVSKLLMSVKDNIKNL